MPRIVFKEKTHEVCALCVWPRNTPVRENHGLAVVNLIFAV